MCCQVLGVRREGYYDWKRRPVHTDRDAETVSTLKQLRQQHPCYGVRGLRDAVSRFGDQASLILHSDHGSQYTSREYCALLTRYGSIRQSMGRTHCCFDNARMESFFATLKKELIYRLHCASINRQQIRQMIFRWIETYLTVSGATLPTRIISLLLSNADIGQTHKSLRPSLACWVCGFLDYSTTWYKRNEHRQGYRSGHYSLNITTTSRGVTLKVPKLKEISFETAIIERYRRRESSVEEALIEMYLAGVSVRRVEDITEALWGSHAAAI